LGDGTNTNRLVPTTVPGLYNATAIATGGAHTCATSFGIVNCWGKNSSGQLGDFTFTNRNAMGSPVYTNEPYEDGPPGPSNTEILHNVIKVSLGSAHSCAVTSYGPVKCWGEDGYGQLGDNGTTDRRLARQAATLVNVIDIGAGFGHSCAVVALGNLYCWGLNGSGQLGNGTTNNRLVPTKVAFAFT